jgi:myo-inositol-1(or 4)-monophosphatase
VTVGADLDGILALAIDLAAESAALIRDAAGSVGAAHTKSSPADLVTAVDRAVEAHIAARLARERPGDGLLAEEGTHAPATSGLRWIVDPLDGTTNFVYGIPAYAVSIGVEHDGRALVGVVHDVAHDEVFAAAAGRGARRNARAIAPSARDSLAGALVGTGFAYDQTLRTRQLAALARLFAAGATVRRVGAASIDLCWVACGRLDAYYEAGLRPWDSAAGALIAREAGAALATIPGDDGVPELLLASTPALLTPLRDALRAPTADLER